MKPSIKLFSQIIYFIIKLISGFYIATFLAFSSLFLIKFLNPNGLKHEFEIGGAFAVSFILASLFTFFIIKKLDKSFVKKFPFLERKRT